MRPYAIRGRLLVGGDLAPGAVVIEDGRIVALTRSARDGDLPETVAEAEIVAPGLVDLQVNGAFGVEVGSGAAALRTLAARLPETGVTAFLPTLISAPTAAYGRLLADFAAARGAPGARMPGLHLEGPFLSPKRPGAHRLDLIAGADPELLETVLGDGAVRIMTLAPERDGALGRIRRLVAAGAVASLGHTDATRDAFRAGVDAGATMATHLFNAMSPFGHREPGAIGAALIDDRVTAGLIADGIHADPGAVTLAMRVKGPERVALVTDAMPAAGLGPGAYELGGRRVTVHDGAARLADGTLAGAVLTLDEAVRNVVRWGGATPAAALRMASETPARAIGHGGGRLVVGADADLALFDADLRVVQTIAGGATVYRREGEAT